MTEDELNWDVELIRSAGVAPRHLAILMDVHRMTAANWLTHQNKPHRLLRDKANRFMRAVRQALDEKELPITKKNGFHSFEIDVRIIALLESAMEKLVEDDA